MLTPSKPFLWFCLKDVKERVYKKMQGEYGGKCREKEDQEIQITKIRISGEKEREGAKGQTKMKDYSFAGLSYEICQEPRLY